MEVIQQLMMVREEEALDKMAHLITTCKEATGKTGRITTTTNMRISRIISIKIHINTNMIIVTLKTMRSLRVIPTLTKMKKASIDKSITLVV